MPNYRRLRQPAATWFFTVNLFDRSSSLLVEEITLLRQAVYTVKRRWPFRIEAMVVLPDHLHSIWTLPDHDSDYSTRWRLIKAAFAKNIPMSEVRSEVQLARRERAVWQRRFWEHHIRDEADYASHLDYCYFNPVKHGLVESADQWPHSTYHRDVRCGRIEGNARSPAKSEPILGSNGRGERRIS